MIAFDTNWLLRHMKDKAAEEDDDYDYEDEY